jgi:hypothetical protein
MAFGHSGINGAMRTVEAQGCPGLVAKAGDSWLMGQSPNNRWWKAPTQQTCWGRAWVAKHKR